MKRGYVKNWRKVKESSFYKKPNVMHLAQHIVREANYKTAAFFDGQKEVDILRGQLCTGRKKLSDETGLSQQEVRTAIKILKNCQFLTIESTKQGSIITVCNYEQYQATEEQEQPTIEPSTNQGPTKGQPLLKNSKEVKKGKKETTPPFQALEFLIDLGVEKQIASDWLKVRKAKRAANTQTAFDTIKREIEKTKKTANEIVKLCVVKSWVGFRADWLKEEEGGSKTASGTCGKSCFNHATCLATGKLKIGIKCGGFTSEETHKR